MKTWGSIRDGASASINWRRGGAEQFCGHLGRRAEGSSTRETGARKLEMLAYTPSAMLRMTCEIVWLRSGNPKVAYSQYDELLADPISIDCRLSRSLTLFVARTVSLRPGLKMVWRLFKRFEPSSCRPKRENLSRLPTLRELSDENWDFRQDF